MYITIDPITHEYLINETKARTIRKIFELYINGHSLINITLFLELIINCTLMDYLYKKEKELLEYSASIEEQLKRAYPAPKTSEFILPIYFLPFHNL